MYLNYTVIRGLAVLSLCSTLLAGCSGIKTYSEAYPDNMRVQTETDSGSIFSSIDASVHIYHLNGRCESTYIGTVDLDRNPTDIGLATDKLHYLNFSFVRSGFLSSSTSTMGYDTLINPRPGIDYQVQLSYLDDLYDVQIREKRPAQSKGRLLKQVPYEACKSGK